MGKKHEHQHAKQKTTARACQVSGCKNKYRAKGYCARHYAQWRRGEFGKGRYRSCSKEDPVCTKPAVKMGLCESHLAEVIKSKQPAKTEAPATPPPAAEAAPEPEASTDAAPAAE